MTGSISKAAVKSACSFAMSVAVHEPPITVKGLLASDGGEPSKMEWKFMFQPISHQLKRVNVHEPLAKLK